MERTVPPLPPHLEAEAEAEARLCLERLKREATNRAHLKYPPPLRVCKWSAKQRVANNKLSSSRSREKAAQLLRLYYEKLKTLQLRNDQLRSRLVSHPPPPPPPPPPPSPLLRQHHFSDADALVHIHADPFAVDPWGLTYADAQCVPDPLSPE